MWVVKCVGYYRTSILLTFFIAGRTVPSFLQITRDHVELRDT